MAVCTFYYKILKTPQGPTSSSKRHKCTISEDEKQSKWNFHGERMKLSEGDKIIFNGRICDFLSVAGISPNSIQNQAFIILLNGYQGIQRRTSLLLQAR